MSAFHRRACVLVAALTAGPCSVGHLIAVEPPAVVFEPPVAFDTGEAGPRDLERADFNRDGYGDVAVLTNGNGGEIHFLLGSAAGGLRKDNTLRVGYASGMGSGDFNRDGVPDLAVTQGSKANGTSDALCDTPGSILPSTAVFLGTGGATPGFALAACLRGVVQSQNLTDVAAGDFDADGLLDLVVVDSNVYGARVYRGVGDGTFRPPERATGSSGIAIYGPLTPADMNGDGRLDVVVKTSGVGTLFGNGSGGLTFSSTPAGSAQLYQHMGVLAFAVADLNNDGRLDIAGVERGTMPAAPTTPRNVVFVSLNSGSGTVYSSSDTEAFPDTTQTTAGRVALADWNRDGWTDVAAVHLDGSTVRLHLGNGDGTVGPATSVPVGVQPFLTAVGDWNLDGWLDLAIVDRNADRRSRTWVLSQVPGILDGTVPTVSLTAPADGATLQGTVALAATATDDTGVTRVEFYQGAVLIGTDASAPYEVLWDTLAVPNGSYLLTAKAYDARGNAGASAGVAVTLANPDTTPPAVTLTAPAAGSMLSGPVPLTATAIDGNGVTRVEFFHGGTLIGADAVPPSPFGVTWETGPVPAGEYTLTAKAYDAAGNVGTSAGVRVTVDRPPTAFAGPAQAVEATSSAGAIVTLAGTGTDPDPGDTLSYRWSQGISVLGTTPSITLTVPLGGSVFTLRVTDSHGAFAEATVNITVEDTSPPVLILPTNLTVGAASGAGAIASFTASALDAVDGPVAVACAPSSGSAFPIGTTTVTCTAADASGNGVSATFMVTVRDLTAPVLTLPPNQSLPATSAAGAIATFSASALDAVDGPVPVVCAPISGSTFPVGTTTVNCTATDAAGNAASGSFTVTVAAAGSVAPRIVSPRPAEEVPVGQLYTYRFVATGSEPLTWSLEAAPAGMTIDAVTGLMSWTPTAAQREDQNVAVRVSNPAGTDRRVYKMKGR